MLAHVHKSGTGTGVEPVTHLNTSAEQYRTGVPALRSNIVEINSPK